MAAAMAVAVLTVPAPAVLRTVPVPVVTVENVAVRLGLPSGRGLSGVCLSKIGPDGRRRVMFKAVGSSRKKPHDGDGDYMVAGDLAADRVYEGTFARLEDGDQVAGFACKGGRRFEIATPFVVPERDLDTMLAVKESMERRFGGQPSRQDPQRSVTAEHVSLTLRGLHHASPVRGDDAITTVDVFQLYKRPADPRNNGSSDAATGTTSRYSAMPFARYALRYPAGDLLLADLPTDHMMAVKVRRAAADGQRTNGTDAAFFVYTGGLYPRGAANLTGMLDERGVAAMADVAGQVNDHDDTETAATSVQIDAKLAHRDSYGKSLAAIR